MKKKKETKKGTGGESSSRKGDLIPTMSGSGLLLAQALTGGLIDERTARQEALEENRKYGEE